MGLSADRPFLIDSSAKDSSERRRNFKDAVNAGRHATADDRDAFYTEHLNARSAAEKAEGPGEWSIQEAREFYRLTGKTIPEGSDHGGDSQISHASIFPIGTAYRVPPRRPVTSRNLNNKGRSRRNSWLDRSPPSNPYVGPNQLARWRAKYGPYREITRGSSVSQEALWRREVEFYRNMERLEMLNTPRNFGNVSGSADRVTVIDGVTYRINSGHAYNRPHSGGDLRNLPVSQNYIESRIVNDLHMLQRRLLAIPPATGSGTRPYRGEINVNGQRIIYEVVRESGGTIRISNYYPPNP